MEPKSATPPNSHKKYKSLTVAQKLVVIEAAENGHKTADIAKRFEISQSMVYQIIRSKDKLESNAKAGQRRRLSTSRFEELENEMKKWLSERLTINDEVQAKEIIAAANRTATKLKITQFKASRSWISAFKRRSNLMHGNDDIKDDSIERLEEDPILPELPPAAECSTPVPTKMNIRSIKREKQSEVVEAAPSAGPPPKRMKVSKPNVIHPTSSDQGRFMGGGGSMSETMRLEGIALASKLQKIESKQQRIIAEKLIGEVMCYAQLGLLHFRTFLSGLKDTGEDSNVGYDQVEYIYEEN